MDSQLLLYIFIGIGLFFAALFLSAKTRPKAPTRLNVKAGENFAGPAESASTSKIIAKGISGVAMTKLSEPATSAQVTQISSQNKSQAASSEKVSSGKVSPEILDPLPNPNQFNDLSAQAKNLSIFFMYNGHDWEAHDVLGIPQGASLVVATEKYQNLLKTEDPSTFEFYESAYNAILQKRKKERL